MLKFSILLLAGLMLLVVGMYVITESRLDSKQAQTQSTTGVLKSPKHTVVQVFATETGWGYAIYRKGKPYIKQTTIPAIEGNKGFSSREKALKAAQLVAYKIEKAILPPTVSRQELDSLQLLTE